ncbi:hypothetical protein HYX13_01045 [Candidatus Woesearchaeota archaeon]|nr:hypothetical protein [Candidatus Woesearchaeota archaeon]
MEEDVILLRCGELFLKGKNQGYFERYLQRNVFQQIGLSAKQLRGRFLLPYFPEHSIISQIFGFTSYSPAVCVEKKIEDITVMALQLMDGCFGTFKIETNRADKQFPLTSVEINMLVGKQLEEQKKLTYARNNPQHTLKVEINQDGAYLFTKTFPCGGGLPVGVEGKVILLLENEASILAGILIMKRGCAIIPVSLNEEEDISLLQKYSPLHLILRKVYSKEDILEIAQKENALALVTGEIFDLIEKIDFLGLEKKEFLLPVFKPLVGYSEENVTEGLKKYAR